MAEEGTGNDTPEKGNDKILGKYNSQEDFEKAYKELERKFHDTKTEHKKAEQFIQLVAPNFVVDEKGENLSWNEDQLKKVAKELGYDMSKEDIEEVKMANQNEFLTKLQENPEEAIKEVVGGLLQSEIKRAVGPVAKDVDQMTVDKMINHMTEKFPDFPEYQKDIGARMKQNNVSIRDVKDLEALYWAEKGMKGNLLDKKNVEKDAELIREQLLKTGSLDLRSGGQTVRDPAKITGDSLLGMDSEKATSKAHEKKAVEIFTGSPAHMLEPSGG